MLKEPQTENTRRQRRRWLSAKRQFKEWFNAVAMFAYV
jgi:hypothetical protein